MEIQKILPQVFRFNYDSQYTDEDIVKAATLAKID